MLAFVSVLLLTVTSDLILRNTTTLNVAFTTVFSTSLFSFLIPEAGFSNSDGLLGLALHPNGRS